MDKYGVVVNVPENKVKEYKFECPACKKKIERVTTNIYICPDCGTATYFLAFYVKNQVLR